MKHYAFCESVHAIPLGKWHIRQLTEKGKKLGGGADTKALCGLVVSWDLNADIIDADVCKNHVCPKCSHEYMTQHVKS